MKLYIIKAFNSFGGGIGEYHVVASGVNKAKTALRASDKIIHRVEVIAQRAVIITE